RRDGRCRLERHAAGQAREPDVVGKDEREATEDAIPGDALADRRCEGERALLPLGEHGRAEGIRLRRDVVGGGDRELGPRSGERLLLAVDAAVREQEASDEREQDSCAADRGDEDDRAGPLALLLDALAGEKVDGAHQSSIPSPIATARAPSWPLEL